LVQTREKTGDISLAIAGTSTTNDARDECALRIHTARR